MCHRARAHTHMYIHIQRDKTIGVIFIDDVDEIREQGTLPCTIRHSKSMLAKQQRRFEVRYGSEQTSVSWKFPDTPFISFAYYHRSLARSLSLF